MTQLKPVDQKPSTWQRTTLLATDNSHSIIGEIVDGKHNPIAYTAYGDQFSKQEDKNRLGFNGQLREAKIAWYLLGNGYRAYNPRLMRFHSPDSWSPFGGGGLNAYMYCAGDPGNRSDPTGHMFDLIVLGLSWVKKNAHLPWYRAKALGPPLPSEQISAALWGLHETKMKIVASQVRPSSSAGVASIIASVGTSNKLPGGSPAISHIGSTSVNSHSRYAAGVTSPKSNIPNRPKISEFTGSSSYVSSQQLNAASDQLSNRRNSLPSYYEAVSPDYEQARNHVIETQRAIEYKARNQTRVANTQMKILENIRKS